MIQSQLLNRWHRLHPRIVGGVHVCWPPGVVTHESWAGYFRDEKLLLMVGGRGRMGLREGWVDWEAGTLFWLSPGFQYTLQQDPENPCECISLHFTLVDGKGQEADGFIRGPEHLVHADSAAEFVLRRLMGLFDVAPGFHGGLPAAHRLMAESWLKSLLIDLEANHYAEMLGANPEATVRDTVEAKVLEWARRVLRNPGIKPSIEHAAERANCSRGHFHRVAREVLNRSPTQFVRIHRMRYARRLLVESDRNISEVAELCGFADVATFSKAFKKAVGTSPSNYRRDHPVFKKDPVVRA